MKKILKTSFIILAILFSFCFCSKDKGDSKTGLPYFIESTVTETSWLLRWNCPGKVGHYLVSIINTDAVEYFAPYHLYRTDSTKITILHLQPQTHYRAYLWAVNNHDTSAAAITGTILTGGSSSKDSLIFYNTHGKIINAVCYGPFRDGQAPGSILTETQIKEDLLLMKNHWDAIRLYTADDNSERILKAISDNHLNLKVLLGIWISGKTPAANAAQVDRAIALAHAYPNIVQALSCGNEIFYNPGSDTYVSDKSEIAAYLGKIHSQTNVPVTIDEVFDVWLNPFYSDLVMLQDFLAIHIYGQWSNVSLGNTVSYIEENYHLLKTRFPNKPVLITETGWTTSKNTGQFIPVADEASQKQFYSLIQQWSTLNKVPVFYFEAFNELWKGPTTTEAETNWGFFYSNRKPKLVFQ